MNKLDMKQKYLDLAALISMGIFSLGYIVSDRVFAELRLQLPFLNFPIFIGEMLIFACLILLLLKYQNNPLKLTKWHYCIIFYFAFVVLKALYGYVHWGPLALRHSALFYYPIFIIFGSVFFRRDLFTRKVCLFLLLIIFIVIGGKYSGYWLFTLVALATILIRTFSSKTLKTVMFLILIAIIPYRQFFNTARMMILSNFVVGLYLMGTFSLVLKVKQEIKLILIIMMGVILVMGLIKFSDKGALKSIVAFKKMAKVIKSYDADIEEKIDGFKFEERKKVNLFNPEDLDPEDSTDSIIAFLGKYYKNKSIETQKQAKVALKQMVIEYVEGKIDERKLEAQFSKYPV